MKKPNQGSGIGDRWNDPDSLRIVLFKGQGSRVKGHGSSHIQVKNSHVHELSECTKKQSIHGTWVISHSAQNSHVHGPSHIQVRVALFIGNTLENIQIVGFTDKSRIAAFTGVVQMSQNQENEDHWKGWNV